MTTRERRIWDVSVPVRHGGLDREGSVVVAGVQVPGERVPVVDQLA